MTTTEEIVQETREDIPLKSGTKATSWYHCNEDSLSGFKFVNIAFGTLTLVITVALLVQIYYGDYQVVPHGSVATDSLECSKIGTTILKKGGNAVDAAIASTFCVAVALPHIASLDGEGQILIYNHVARSVPKVIDFSSPNEVSVLPRLILGLAYAHKHYGKLKWKELVEPAAKLAKDGYLVSRMLVQAISRAKAEDVFGRLEAGQILKLDKLGDTLLKIANIPDDQLYNSFESGNQPIHAESLKYTFNNYNIYVPNAPSVGPQLLANLQEIEKHNFKQNDTTKPEYIYRIAEITQLIYNELNISSKFHKCPSTNVAVIDLHDNYISIVTGMYNFFGVGEKTEHGYVLDVKSKPKTCSRLALLITDAEIVCARRIVLGASDVAIATQLISTMAISKENATDAVEAPRFNLLENTTIAFEDSHLPSFGDDIVKYLSVLTLGKISAPEPYDSCNIVEKVKDDLTSHSDSRGGGIASRF